MNRWKTLNNEPFKRDLWCQIWYTLITAQTKVKAADNSAMVQAYWEIGEQIYLAGGENDRAEYGKGLKIFIRGIDKGI